VDPEFAGGLPAEAVPRAVVLSHQGDERQARLRVCNHEFEAAEKFATACGAQVQKRPLNLEEMFPLLTSRGGRDDERQGSYCRLTRPVLTG